LEYLGIRGVALELLKSYLTKRKQCTVLVKDNRKYYSTWMAINSGVPQGSILGPLLFLIFINDISKQVPSNLFLYADDTTALIKSNSLTDLFNTAKLTLNQLGTWFSSNGLLLNNEKTKLIHFKAKSDSVNFHKI
jgi:hypothetical protein